MTAIRILETTMDVYHLSQFTKGWFVGDFSPTLLATSHVEVGIKTYKAGDVEAAHHHKIAAELTAVVSGRVRMGGKILTAGQIIRIEPCVSTTFEALEDSVTVVVKTPSIVGDKYID